MSLSVAIGESVAIAKAQAASWFVAKRMYGSLYSTSMASIRYKSAKLFHRSDWEYFKSWLDLSLIGGEHSSSIERSRPKAINVRRLLAHLIPEELTSDDGQGLRRPAHTQESYRG
jgi:hypothetical protein